MALTISTVTHTTKQIKKLLKLILSNHKKDLLGNFKPRIFPWVSPLVINQI